MTRALGYALLAGCALVSCSRPDPLPPAVATFQGGAVRSPELKAELDRLRVETRPWGEASVDAVAPDAEQLKVLRRAALDRLVDRHLLLIEATRAGLSVTDAELDEALKARTSLAIEPEARVDSVDPATQKERVREDLLLDRYLVREVAARVAVPPDEALAWYQAHLSEFQRPDQVRCSQIMVPTRDEAAALKIQLNRGSDFAKLAREQSTSDDRVRGGDLGWFGKGEMPEEFEKSCFALKRGAVSDPVQSPYGYHLLKLFDRRDGAKVPFSEVESQIDLRLRRERVAAAQAELVAKLREQAGVGYVEEEIDRVP